MINSIFEVLKKYLVKSNKLKLKKEDFSKLSQLCKDIPHLPFVLNTLNDCEIDLNSFTISGPPGINVDLLYKPGVFIGDSPLMDCSNIKYYERKDQFYSTFGSLKELLKIEVIEEHFSKGILSLDSTEMEELNNLLSNDCNPIYDRIIELYSQEFFVYRIPFQPSKSGNYKHYKGYKVKLNLKDTEIITNWIKSPIFFENLPFINLTNNKPDYKICNGGYYFALNEEMLLRQLSSIKNSRIDHLYENIKNIENKIKSLTKSLNRENNKLDNELSNLLFKENSIEEYVEVIKKDFIK